MDPYKITFATWNKVADLYQEKYMDLDMYDDTYELFCNSVTKQNARILEIGCGPGNITGYLLSRRPDFDILGIDIAPNMISLAEKNNPAATFAVMDCRHINHLKEKYDAVVCGFCVPYLSKSDLAKLFNDVATLLDIGGTLYCSCIEGDYAQSGFLAASTGDESYVYYYQENEIEAILRDNGFLITEVSRKNFTNGSSVHLIMQAKLDQNKSKK